MFKHPEINQNCDVTALAIEQKTGLRGIVNVSTMSLCFVHLMDMHVSESILLVPICCSFACDVV
jgi:hypothetical protein